MNIKKMKIYRDNWIDWDNNWLDRGSISMYYNKR
jgi:hypothetical protein